MLIVISQAKLWPTFSPANMPYSLTMTSGIEARKLGPTQPKVVAIDQRISRNAKPAMPT